MNSRTIVAIALVVMGLVAGRERAEAATLTVALSGTDGPSCGSASAPCRSINQAIVNASPGEKPFSIPVKAGE